MSTSLKRGKDRSTHDHHVSKMESTHLFAPKGVLWNLACIQIVDEVHWEHLHHKQQK